MDTPCKTKSMLTWAPKGRPHGLLDDGHRAMEYVMEYGWDTNVPPLETRHYIDVLGQDITYNDNE